MAHHTTPTCRPILFQNIVIPALTDYNNSLSTYTLYTFYIYHLFSKEYCTILYLLYN